MVFISHVHLQFKKLQEQMLQVHSCKLSSQTASNSLRQVHKTPCQCGVPFLLICAAHYTSPQTTCHRGDMLLNNVQTKMQQEMCLFVADETIKGK